VICVEAGLSVDKATMRTAEELRISQPAIADEMNLVYLEQRAGRPRAEAWKTLENAPTSIRFVRWHRYLIQADKFGTSVGKTLRNSRGSVAYATAAGCGGEGGEDHRETYLSASVVLSFPRCFVVTLGPSMIVMLEGFEKFFELMRRGARLNSKGKERRSWIRPP